jgi:hypothetical protein
MFLSGFPLVQHVEISPNIITVLKAELDSPNSAVCGVVMWHLGRFGR